MNNIQNITEETKEYITAIEEYLLKKYGKIERRWMGLLSMLTSQYDIFIMSRDALKETGLLTTNKFGIAPNPMLKINNDASIQIQKIIQALSISPTSENKLKEIATDDDDEKIKKLFE